MANEVWNLWGAPNEVPGSTMSNGMLWHSGALSTAPSGTLQHSSMLVTVEAEYSTNPTTGDVLELLYFPHDGTNYYGDLAATTDLLTLGPMEVARDAAHLIRRNTSSGANVGPLIFGGVVHDPTINFQLGMYLESSTSLLAVPIIRYQYFDPQGQS